MSAKHIESSNGPTFRPPSPLRLAANRRNALKSTGPRTLAGKRRAALNGLQNLCPEKLARRLRARGEEPRDFDRLLRDLMVLFEPRDAAANYLVQALAKTWWEKARRIRQWVPAGHPPCQDLDARLDRLLVSMAFVQRLHWKVRLTAILDSALGSPAQVRCQIEQRLFIFGARPADRKYRKTRLSELSEEEVEREVGRLLSVVRDDDRIQAMGDSPAAGEIGMDEPNRTQMVQQLDNQEDTGDLGEANPMELSYSLSIA